MHQKKCQEKGPGQLGFTLPSPASGAPAGRAWSRPNKARTIVPGYPGTQLASKKIFFTKGISIHAEKLTSFEMSSSNQGGMSCFGRLGVGDLDMGSGSSLSYPNHCQPNRILFK